MSERQPQGGQLDATRPQMIFICGRKRTGKSVLARRLYETYPHDRMCIDPTGDALPEGSALLLEHEQLTGSSEEWPDRFPARLGGGVEPPAQVSIHFVPDAGADTYVEDMDRATGMAIRHPRKRVMLWYDEVHEATQVGRTLPNMRRLLNTSRHLGASSIMCGPRPMNVNPLCISQADWIYIFDLPNKRDRERIADLIGWEYEDVHAAIRNLPSEHHYLRWDTANRDMSEWPPLPLHALDQAPAGVHAH